MTIEIAALSRRFDRFPALDRASLTIGAGELVALLGPSGSGKTTLLRLLAGLELPDEGRILFDGEDVTEVEPRLRRVGLVFQHYALFRHMRVADNIAFGLDVRRGAARPTRAAIRTRVAELLRLVQLDGLGDRYPAQLSGGQRQRVALARALAIDPRLLLLDEPFGALDATVRRDLRRWLRDLHRRIDITSILVTHDQEEAMEVADRIVVLDRGRIQQIGAPQDLLDAPATPFVAAFIGQAAAFEAVVEGEALRFDGWALPAAQAGWPAGRSGRAIAYVKPHDLDIVPEGAAAGRGIAVTVEDRILRGVAMRLSTRDTAGRTIQVELSRERAEAAAVTGATGEAVRLRPRAARAFPA